MSKKKYKLKGARKKLSRYYNFGVSPEGEPFVEVSDTTSAMRLYESGVIELYKNSALVCRSEPTTKERRKHDL